MKAILTLILVAVPVTASAVTWIEAQNDKHPQWMESEWRDSALESLVVPQTGIKVDLPDKTTLDIDDTFLDDVTKRLSGHTYFPHDKQAYSVASKDGGLAALFVSLQGKLIGPMLVFHDDATHSIAIAASFADGHQEGNLLTWDDKGQPQFFGQFRSTHRDGWFANFEDGKLVAVAKFKHDKRIAACAIKDDKVVESIEDGVPPFGSKVDFRLGQIDHALKAIREREGKMKHTVEKWDESLRKELAAVNGIEERNAILERGRADNTGLILALRRWGNGY
jgi:hypothetical protein